MKRKFIGIEQMDYINEVTVPRMVSVINGEKGGVSKSQNWLGGGSFIYFELLKNNSFIIDKINRSKNSKDLVKIWESLKENDFISYKFDISHINKDTTELQKIPFIDLQRLLIELLDKNNLYVNFYDVKDKSHHVSTNDIKLTHQFYTNE